jgi:hypothetical protein
LAADREITPRIQRELDTVRAMLRIFCSHRHGSGRDLCPDCAELWDYTQDRVGKCPFAEDKPTCVNCTVHCFRPEKRERIREVMRYSGPRMPWRHPVLTIFHFIDGKRPTPTLKELRDTGSEGDTGW